MPRTVLIVDDDDGDRFLLRRLLTAAQLAAEIHEQVSVEEALEHLRTVRGPQAYDLIFLDLRMPGLDGFDFLTGFESLRAANEDLRSTAVIVLTSSSSPTDQERVLGHAFVHGCLRKMPSSAEHLAAEIERCEGRSRAS